jgi:hypothetical protein
MSAKKKLPPFKKHILIPLGLSVFIVVAGIVMTLTDQAGIGRERATRIGQEFVHVNSSNYTITGPGVIGLGLVLTILLSWMWIKLKK